MTKGVLLGITKASTILGVHSRTLRRWADEGHLPYLQTPGGHRRFVQQDLEKFIQQMAQSKNDQYFNSLKNKEIQENITDSSSEISPNHSHFPIDLNDNQKKEMRSIGRLLVGLVIQYASEEKGEAILEKARKLGTSYGKLCRNAGMSVSTTIETFNFYRNPILEVTFASAAKSQEAKFSKPHLYRRLDRFFNEVLVATVRAVEGNN